MCVNITIFCIHDISVSTQYTYLVRKYKCNFFCPRCEQERRSHQRLAVLQVPKQVQIKFIIAVNLHIYCLFICRLFWCCSSIHLIGWFATSFGGRRMVVRFTTSYAIGAYHHWCFVFYFRSGRGVQHYGIKFVSDLWQVCSFLRVLWFTPPIQLTATI